MANKYYQPGELRGEKVEDLFATIAPRYDLINDLQSFGLHRLWKRQLVRLADPCPGQRALDLCSGTGDVAFGLAQKGAAVVGLDFSASMLAMASRRARADFRNGAIQPSRVAGGTPLFIRGDAQALPFPDESFDLVTVSYGLRNLSSWELGLREMWRVAARSGRLLVLDFGKPDQALWRALYFAYLRSFVPLFGKVFCGDSQTHSYIMESLRHYPAQHGVAARMRDLGCRDVRILPLWGGMMTINCGVKP